MNSATGDGTPAGGAFSFVVPYAKPQCLTAEVIVDAGSTRSLPSVRSDTVVVGEKVAVGSWWVWERRCSCSLRVQLHLPCTAPTRSF